MITPEGSVTINGGTVTATGGGNFASRRGGAGIGTAALNSSQENKMTITVNGGTVTATGGGESAGIGGGHNGDGGTVVIAGGNVTATGATGAGIGGGSGKDAGAITISGGTIAATGGSGSADIGPGGTAMGGTIFLTGSYNASDAEASPHITAQTYAGKVTFGKVFVSEDDTATALNAEALSDLGSRRTIFPKEVGEPVPYLDENGEERLCITYITLDQAWLDAGSTTLGTAGAETWYVVDGADSAGVVSAASRLYCAGDVHLILKNDSTLDATHGGIGVTVPHSLSIYQQPEKDGENTGILNAQATDWHAGIGGDGSNTTGNMASRAAGIITINGGIISAKGPQTYPSGHNGNAPGIEIGRAHV